tara:strand:- start:904 stop:1140 length:237 start_codon:yes stop_codon:yes gene_type:complete
MAMSLMAGPISQALMAIQCFEQEQYETYQPRSMSGKGETNVQNGDAHYIDEADLRKILSQYLHCPHQQGESIVDVLLQ